MNASPIPIICRPEARSPVRRRSVAACAWPAADRPYASVAVHRCRWRLSLTSSLGHSRSGRERLLSLTRFSKSACGLCSL